MLITASTYPRWSGDSTPPFVQQFAEHLVRKDRQLWVLAPHFRNARTTERSKGIYVRRYRYFLPTRMEDIAYNGGGVYKIRKTSLYAIKLVLFITCQFFATLWLVLVKRIDIINAHWVIPQGFVAILVKFITGRKVILTVHGGDVFNLTGTVMTRVKRFVLKHADEVCPNSLATRKMCETIYRREYKIIPMGIDMSRFFPMQPSKKLQDTHALHNFTILFVGRLTEVKGVRYLLEAAAQLRKKTSAFNVLIVGDGPLREEFNTYIHDQGLEENISIVGWVDGSRLNEYYALADVFVGPSLSEPQGIVFIEALASGTPVIATKVGGIVDIVSDGETGILVTPGSAEAIADALGHLIDNPSIVQSFGLRARESVIKRFSWEGTATAYGEIIDKAID